MTLLPTELATELGPIFAAVILAVSAYCIRTQTHARHRHRVQQLAEATVMFQRQADAARGAAPAGGSADTGVNAMARPETIPVSGR
jgi:hypothetical protein